MQLFSRISWCFTLSFVLNTWIITSQALAQNLPGEIADRTVPVDLSDYNHQSGVVVQSSNRQLLVTWPLRKDGGEFGRLTLNLDGQKSLIDSLAIARQTDGPADVLLSGVEPVTLLTVGSRQGLRNPGWVVFFDRVWKRPFKTFQGKLDLQQVRVVSKGRRTTVVLDRFTAGPFSGDFRFTVYPGGRLVHAEAVVSTKQDRCAILYDAGLVSASEQTSWNRVAWLSTSGQTQSFSFEPDTKARELAVRHRTIMAESDAGTVALFPLPHQFFYPQDESLNLKFVWYGTGFRGLENRFGLGIRQHFEGDRRFVPWFNAPPGTKQRLGIFYLLSRGNGRQTLPAVLRYTHGDRFVELPGYRTFTSHCHFAHTMNVMERRDKGLEVDDIPSFVTILKNMGVNIVHLAEFHGDGDPRDPGPKRLPQLELMHHECERLSDANFLLLPGEEPNVYFGGHWIDLFPKPVYWIMKRSAGQPFQEASERYGTVYRVGSTEDLAKLLKQEGGLGWTAHPRIKSSTGYPDRHRESELFRSDRWLGAAWKSMPADLSRPKLGERVLDLLDDMTNWGQPKYVLGEVDVFKIDPTHELYAHMNINYLKLDKVPRFRDGWQPVLDALRQGRFFVSTGEVLISNFTIGGKETGDMLQLPANSQPELRANLQWTFPLQFAEVVSGDGKQVFRQRIGLTDTMPFSSRELRLNPNLTGRKWVRFEVWDVAANGAFTQPVWLDEPQTAEN